MNQWQAKKISGTQYHLFSFVNRIHKICRSGCGEGVRVCAGPAPGGVRQFSSAAFSFQSPADAPDGVRLHPPAQAYAVACSGIGPIARMDLPIWREARNRSKRTFDCLAAAGHKGPHGNDAAKSNTQTRGVGVRNGRYNYHDDRQQCQPLLRSAGPFVVG